jgi:hypothetical protein
LAICYHLLEKCLFRSFAHFKISFLLFCCQATLSFSLRIVLGPLYIAKGSTASAENMQSLISLDHFHSATFSWLVALGGGGGLTAAWFLT